MPKLIILDCEEIGVHVCRAVFGEPSVRNCAIVTVTSAFGFSFHFTSQRHTEVRIKGALEIWL